MIPPTCKRLIEVDFPIAKVSEYSAQEKESRVGHIPKLHIWPAARPTGACRAVLMGLLLPAPTDRECPADFKAKARLLLRKRHSKALATDQELQDDLLAFIGEFADWEHAANALYLEIGRGLVKAAHPEETPLVVDPFAGGGSIPLEALRLGCEAFASDLNPVACLILKTLLEDIPRYGNAEFRFKKPRIDTNEHEFERKGVGVHSSSLVVEEDEIVIRGLANALQYVGKQIKEAVEKELAQFYPPDPDGSRPIAYLWARTVRCEAPGCGAEIPLVRSFWLCKKAGRKRALRYMVERPKAGQPFVQFEIFTPESDKDVPEGTVQRAEATCPCCHIVLPAARVRAQLAAQRGGADVQFDAHGKRASGARLLAVVTLREGATGRFYRLPTPRDYAAVFAVQKAVAQLPKGAVPDEPTPVGGGSGAGRAFSVQRYGMLCWGDLFSVRQKVALAEFVRVLRSGILPESCKGLTTLCFSKMVDMNNALSSWQAHAEIPAHLFTRYAIPMRWDFSEGVPIADSSGSFASATKRTSDCLPSVLSIYKRASVSICDARVSSLPASACSVWFTDPPYYDAVPYSDLSDFFFVWLKRALPGHPLMRDPKDSANALTPKAAEIVQDETRKVEGGVKDRSFFEREMGRAFAEGRRIMRDDGVACIVFAHKTTEGWEALISGMLRGGWAVTASWPIATEMGSRLRARDSAALATSVHLVCRPRSVDAGVGDWSEVKAAMEKRIREWLLTLTKHGVRGADAIFSCLGPALESYSRYERVLTAADREVPLGGDPDATEPEQRGFLAYVFEALSKEALRQVLGDAETEGFEEDARLTALFLWTLQSSNGEGRGGKGEGKREKGEEEEEEEEEERPKKAKAGYAMPFDTFIRITRPMGIHYQALEGRILEIEKGVVRLLPVRERTEELLGEAATGPGIEIILDDFRQLELGLLQKGEVKREREEVESEKGKGRREKGKGASEFSDQPSALSTLDRLHRAMLLFSLGRSALLRQVLETEMRQGKRFERLALSLNALYPDGSDERRMLEGVQAAMRGVK